MTAKAVLSALRDKHKGMPFFEQVKDGPTWGGGGLSVVDALAVKISWTSPCITGYEVKVSRGDFVGDEKWPNYLPLCHKFYWACPAGLIKKGEVDPRVGLVYVKANGQCYTRKKALHRDVELPTELLYYLVLYRHGRENDEFQQPEESGGEYRRRTIAEFLEGKRTARMLNIALRSRVAERVVELEGDVQRVERELESYKTLAADHGFANVWAMRAALAKETGNVDMRELAALVRSVETHANRGQTLLEQARELHATVKAERQSGQEPSPSPAPVPARSATGSFRKWQQGHSEHFSRDSGGTTDEHR